MIPFALRRLLQAAPVLAGVSLAVFFMIHLIPGDPARLYAGLEASQEDVENVRRALGLGEPLPVQYGRFLGRFVTGDLGRSLKTGRPVGEEIAARYASTAFLAVLAIASAIVLGAATGVVAAVWRRTAVDHAALLTSLLGLSLPPFFLGLVLMLFFSVQLGWLPLAGNATWRHAVLPAATLALPASAVISRMVRGSLVEVMEQDYIRTARAKGLTEWVVVNAHAVRNALIPVVTVVGLQLGYLLGGAVVTETVFSWPGIGRLIVQAIAARDFPVVQAAVLLLAVTFVGINLAHRHALRGPGPEDPPRVRRRWRELRRARLALPGAAVVCAFAVAALLAPWLAPDDPTRANLANVLARPSTAHLLGTDELGRDVFSRIVHGARLSMLEGLFAVALAAMLGVPLGLVAGYAGGAVDTVIMRFVDVLLAFPGVLLAVAAVSILGPGLWNAMVAVAIYTVPIFARLARGSTLVVKREVYIEGCHALGMSDLRIVGRHVLPNIAAPLLVMSALRVAVAILTAASLSFLGLGAQPPTPEWGAMLSNGRNYVLIAPHLVIFPGLAILLLVLGLNLLQEGLRLTLDPRLTER